MLNEFRPTISWARRIFLSIVLTSFIFFEIPNILQNWSNNILLRSGKSVIELRMYQLALNDLVSRHASAIGHYLAENEIKQLAIPQRVFNNMYTDILLDEQVRRMKVSASNIGTARMLGRDSLFKGIDGQFDKNRFINYVQQVHTTQASFFRYLKARARRDQVIAASIGELQPPDAFYSGLLLFQKETRVVDYLELVPTFIGRVADPDKKTLEHWFEERKNYFRTPEYRQITYMRMYVEDIARPQDVTEEAIKTFYEKNMERYSTPEKRTIELLRFKTREAADAAVDKLAAGTSFDELVTEEQQVLTDIRQGPLKKSEMPTLISSDVFGLEKGAVSYVINDIQGPVIIRVIDIEPAVSTPLSIVQKEIRNEIANAIAFDTLRDNRKKIENARFEGATLKELSSEYGLIAHKMIIDANGKTIDGFKLIDLPDPSRLIPAIFQAAVGMDTDPLNSSDGYIWYHVERLIASRELTLDQAYDMAIASWKEQKIQRALDIQALEMKEELDKGSTIEVLAEQYGLAKYTEHELQRNHISKKLGETATIAAFSGTKGTNGVANGADGKSRIVFKVIDVIKPPDTAAQFLPAYERHKVSEDFMDDMKALLISVSAQIHPVRINAGLYNRLLQ